MWNLGAASPLNKVIVLQDGASIWNENGVSAVDGAVTVQGSATFNAGGTSLTFNGVISGSGGLAKTGTGQLFLNAANTYSGPTLVNAGSLVLTDLGSINNSSAITVTSTLDVSGRSDGTLALAGGQTLMGAGTVNGSLVVNAGATVAPGAPLGTLNVASSLTLQGAAAFEIDKTLPAADAIRAASITYGGTLNVIMVGAALAGGDSFKLFDASSYAGSFTNIQPASPGTGMTWDLSSLGVDGTLKVVGPPPAPAIGAISLSGGNLVFSGANGTAGRTYQILSSTNLTLPLAAWTPVLTNVFDANGNFSVNLAVEPAAPLRFFLLNVP